MNTTEKGNNLEEIIYSYLQSIIDNHINANGFSVVHKHKRYQMENGDSYVADVSIDKYLRKDDYIPSIGIDKPTLSYIFECKNYNHPVDKSDFQEFQYKIEHTRNTRVKGYLVSTSSYTEQTISTASYQGVGLVIVNINENTHNIIVSRRLNYKENEIDLYNTLIGKESHMGVIVFSNYKFTNIRSILAEENITLKEEFQEVKYIKNIEIEELAYKLIVDANAIQLDASKTLDKILSFLGISVIQENLDDELLGVLNITDNMIILSNSLTGHRKNFTIAHEIGHYVLHSKALKHLLAEYGENVTSISIGNKTNNHLERQANHFASWLLLPNLKLQKGFDLFRQEEEIKQNYIYVDSQPDNMKRYYRLQDYMRNLFNVSWQVLEIRLRQNDMLRFDNRNTPQSISEIITNNSVR